MRTNEELDHIRATCREAIQQNATAHPGIHVKQIGYETTKRWLEGDTNLNPLEEVPTGNLLPNGRNTGPQYETGVLMALDEVFPLKEYEVWIDPDFLEYLEERQGLTEVHIMSASGAIGG